MWIYIIQKTYWPYHEGTRAYTAAQFNPQKTPCNESVLTNELKREFQRTEAKKVVIIDSIYVKVKNKWHCQFRC